MIINQNNTLVEFNDEEQKIIKFFLENSFRTLSDMIVDRVISPDFVFPGIFDLDKAQFNVLLNKLQELNINTHQIDAAKILSDDKFLFDEF